MTDSYRLTVTLVDYDDTRKGELKLYLNTLHPEVGQDELKAYCKRARSGEDPVVYQTNSPSDAKRIAHMIAMKGGAATIAGLEALEDEED